MSEECGLSDGIRDEGGGVVWVGNITRAAPAIFFFYFSLGARVTFVTAKVTKTMFPDNSPCGFTALLKSIMAGISDVHVAYV